MVRVRPVRSEGSGRTCQHMLELVALGLHVLLLPGTTLTGHEQRRLPYG